MLYHSLVFTIGGASLLHKHLIYKCSSVYQDMILCLDGGGIRGLVLITMLQFIEEKSGRQIKNVFNFYGGTSTGGILALAFGLKENELKDRLERSLQRKKITHQHFGNANIC